MMVRLAAMAGLAVVALSATAFAETDADRARKWGLLGTWATDCSMPPTDSDPYLIYQADGARVVHRRNYPKSTDTNQIKSVQLADDGGLRLEIYLPNVDPPQIRIYELDRDGDRVHTKYNYRPSDKSYSIKDFVIVANGQPAVWIYKCK